MGTGLLAIVILSPFVFFLLVACMFLGIRKMRVYRIHYTDEKIQKEEEKREESTLDILTCPSTNDLPVQTQTNNYLTLSSEIAELIVGISAHNPPVQTHTETFGDLKLSGDIAELIVGISAHIPTLETLVLPVTKFKVTSTKRDEFVTELLQKQNEINDPSIQSGVVGKCMDACQRIEKALCDTADHMALMQEFHDYGCKMPTISKDLKTMSLNEL
jgi:hypothetical protein